MRRPEGGYAPRQAGLAPFRVLVAPESNFLTPPTAPPPPPRAPEPYKVAPSSTSFARAHRRSSFVIIADSRPATPESRGSSPTLATGRVSPFRGRGFKGPPPARSRSRPQSPEALDGRRRGRNERRVSVSQQNSPRRSLIPQPTRQRSTSLTKSNENISSPKIGRRVDSRTRLNAAESRTRLNSYNSSSNSNLASRRQVSKITSRLSPIQGTPTKPEKTSSQITRSDRFRGTSRASPTKTQKAPMTSSRIASNARKSTQEKSSSKERLTSPSKIPLKTSKGGSSATNPSRFITLTNEPTERKLDKEAKDAKIEAGRSKDSVKNSKQSETSFSLSSKDPRGSSSNVDKVTELDLIGLVKRTSRATGTSSVVNTTATTAVQPLHIDANAVLVERESSEKKSSPADHSRNPPDTSIIAASTPPTANDTSSSAKEAENKNTPTTEDRSANSQVSSKSSKTSNGHARPKTVGEAKNETPGEETMGSHSKTNSVGQSAKNQGRMNGTSAGPGSATQRTSKSNGAASEQASRTGSNGNQRAMENSTAPSSGREHPAAASRSTEVDGSQVSGKMNSSGTSNRVPAAGNGTAKGANEAMRSNGTETKVGNSTIATMNSTTSKMNSVQVNSAVGAVNVPRNVNSAGGRARNGNRGSNASLKSSTGVSTDSIESVRSTDTGVSVNTVRGVSSPREKMGMHVVKRPQDIETLSGNVMHLEQNGEPAVLAAANGLEEGRSAAPERLVTRWKRSFNRYCQCCPGMRCLACRRDTKGLSWPRKQATMRNQEQRAAEVAEEAPVAGCWPRFKARCRCNRSREMKCCMRRSRVAPAEATACCPPERRFGAICRRLFDSCKCKRADAERTRSIRAKHSLTSMAPPPLSEEPKAKIPDVLVEHNSLMRGAIPCLPVPLAWFCLIWNVLLPGTGTVWSGLFNLCTGQPRFSAVAGLKSRLGAFIVNLVVGVGQLFTVLFCLVGWGWSIWWGVTLVRLARKYKRFKASEAANNDPEARGGEPAALPPGVPSQALRGMERAR